jgi:hypothetical protein
MIRTDLSESGRDDLAADVVIEKNGRPVWHWYRLGRALSHGDVQRVHAAFLRAYEAYAPSEVGEEAGQFTGSSATWFDAIRKAGGCRRSDRESDCDEAVQSDMPAGLGWAA